MPNHPQQQIVGSEQVITGSVGRSQLNIITPNQAVVRRLIAGLGIGLSSTGIDSGTGDVSVFVTGTFFTEEQIENIAQSIVDSTSIIPKDGWILDSGWIRFGNHSFGFNGDNTAVFRKGLKLRWSNSPLTKYGVVASSGFTSGSVTTVNLIPNTDYIISGTITTPYYSPIENPEGWVDWFNWSPTRQANEYSVNPTLTVYRWRATDKKLELMWREGADGTAGSATTNTLSLPVVAATITNAAWVGAHFYTDGGVGAANMGGAQIFSAGTLINLFTATGSGAWTPSLGKRSQNGFVTYEY